MNVKEITTKEELNSILEEGKGTVIKFFAEWCGPCQMQAQIFETVASKDDSGSVNYIEVDIDKARDLASEMGVMSIPTFAWFKGTEKVKVAPGMLQENQIVEEITTIK